jgi:hypothetical protein
VDLVVCRYHGREEGGRVGACYSMRWMGGVIRVLHFTSGSSDDEQGTQCKELMPYWLGLACSHSLLLNFEMNPCFLSK